MPNDYALYPSIGVARVGNSPTEFVIAPDQIGGLPQEYDPSTGEARPLTQFKDNAGKIKRQAQLFRIFRPDGTTELTINDPDVESIAWTVHLANKKSAWYQFSEYKGNLLFGQNNNYDIQGVPFRNADFTDPEEEQDKDIAKPRGRQKLIIDPGPVTITASKSNPSSSIAIDRNLQATTTYPFFNFPPAEVEYGSPIDTLGKLQTDVEGRLLVFGGLGKSGGDEDLASYGGADTWFDDISDGSVTCTITFTSGSSKTLNAWVIVGPPDFAPEVVNISTWADTIFDVYVRNYNLVPEMRNGSTWNLSFQANYYRDILPILHRIAGYHWVANVQPMIPFSSNFDFSNPTESIQNNVAYRQLFFSYFQPPAPIEPVPPPPAEATPRQYELFSGSNVPKMPLNSGSNSVSNYNIEKFLALNETQHFLLRQWANGVCTYDQEYQPYPIDSRNTSSVGNCVGLPQCPGIEVTWTIQNPVIYNGTQPYHILPEIFDFNLTGLSPDRDECRSTTGCQPGDLTKRMAIPWQADFYNCTIQNVNFTDPNVNKVPVGGDPNTLTPKLPTYYAYWWPPQAPWDVISGAGLGFASPDDAAADQDIAHVNAGLQVNFLRGINSYVQMVNNGWSYIGFIRNRNTESGQQYPFLVETERDNDMFIYYSVPVGQITGREDDDETEIPVFALRTVTDQEQLKSMRFRNLGLKVAKDIFKEIKMAKSEKRKLPRSGTRLRF